MICRLSGKLVARSGNRIIVSVGGVGYEVWMPSAILNLLDNTAEGEPIELVTLYYMQLDTSKAVPILVGFINELQKEFFEKLLTVPKMGPKLALAAFSRPMSQVAQAIEQGNVAFLRSLPGVGNQKAKDIIATLQGKVAKFALFRDESGEPARRRDTTDVTEDALQMLIALGYKKGEAEHMIQESMLAEPQPADAEELVRMIYKKQESKERSKE